MELEEAAAQGVKACETLKQNIQEAATMYTALEEKLNTAKQRFDADWQKVHAAGQALVEDLGKRAAEMEGHAQEASDAQAKLKQQVETTTNESNTAVASSKEAHTALKDGVEGHELEMKETTDQANEKGNELKDHTDEIEQALSKIFADASEHLSQQIAAEIQKLLSEHQQKGQELEAHADDSKAQVSEAHQQAVAKVQEAQTKVQEHATTIAQDHQDHAKGKMAETQTDIETTLASIQEEVHSAMQEVSDLQAAIANGSGVVKEGHATMQSALEDVHAAGVESAGSLKGASDAFAKMSFGE